MWTQIREAVVINWIEGWAIGNRGEGRKEDGKKEEAFPMNFEGDMAREHFVYDKRWLTFLRMLLLQSLDLPFGNLCTSSGFDDKIWQLFGFLSLKKNSLFGFYCHRQYEAESDN